MNPCPLNVLHDSGNENVFSVADCIHFYLFPLKIFVHQNRMLLRDLINDSHELFNILIIHCDLHPLSAQNIGRSHKHRIAEFPRCLLGFLRSIYGFPFWSGNFTLLQNLIKEFPVFCRIYILLRSSENRNSHLHQILRKFDRCLTSKLYHRAIRMFQFHNSAHVLGSQRFKIQFICNIKICAYRLRIIVDNDRLISFLFKCPRRMDAAEIKFNALSDSDRSGAKNQYLFSSCRNLRLIFASVYGIIIWCLRIKFRSTRINNLIRRTDSISTSHLSYFFLGKLCQFCNDTVREFHFLSFQQYFSGQRLSGKLRLHLHKLPDPR